MIIDSITTLKRRLRLLRRVRYIDRLEAEGVRGGLCTYATDGCVWQQDRRYKERHHRNHDEDPPAPLYSYCIHSRPPSSFRAYCSRFFTSQLFILRCFRVVVGMKRQVQEGLVRGFTLLVSGTWGSHPGSHP